MSFGLLNSNVLLFRDNYFLLCEICSCHIPVLVEYHFLEWSDFVLHCSDGSEQLVADVFDSVRLTFHRLHLIHSLLMFVWRIFGLFWALFHTFYDLLHLHVQFVNASFEQRFGQITTVHLGPEGFGDFSNNSMLYFVQVNTCIAKTYLTAVALNARFNFVGGFAKCFTFPHLLSVTELFLVILLNTLWSLNPTSVCKSQVYHSKI